MDGEERRKRILDILSEAKTAVTGTELSHRCKVSRQIVVGDVALMRAQGMAIISTPRGYQLVRSEMGGVTKTFVCCHGNDLMRQELEAIVDNGGIVQNVCVEHDVYGYLEGALKLRSRRDVAIYIKHMEESKAELLCSISGGIHTHLVETESQDDMEAIEAALDKLGVLYKS
jgi:transcriptional regulator of NAD metabolism